VNHVAERKAVRARLLELAGMSDDDQRRAEFDELLDKLEDAAAVIDKMRDDKGDEGPFFVCGLSLWRTRDAAENEVKQHNPNGRRGGARLLGPYYTRRT